MVRRVSAGWHRSRHNCHCRFGCCLDEEIDTESEEANLYGGVATGPEIEFDAGPDGGGVLKLELEAGGGEREGLYQKCVNTNVVQCEVLHGWVS